MAEDAVSLLHALAMRADVLWSHNSGRAVGGVLSAVHEEPSEGDVAEVQSGGRGRKQSGGGAWGATRGGGRDQYGRGAARGGGRQSG